MSCTVETLKMFGVFKNGLVVFFKDCGHPLTLYMLEKHLKDQKWQYEHAVLLSRIDLWEEPVFYGVGQSARKLFAKHTYGGRALGEIGEANPEVMGLTIEVRLPKDKEDE